MRHELEKIGETPCSIDTPRIEESEEIPSRIQGAVGIGVLRLGERHQKGCHVFFRGEAWYNGGASVVDKVES
ncbi:hypothetical protein M1307_01250 [Patescibacteria group bacterium]|nr:hypothetical protein [Patescibacteria group bacterium]